MIISGIYCITNTIENIKYIGQSQNIFARWKQHIRDADRVELNSIELYKAIREYGIESFIFQVLEVVEENLLNEREFFWTEYFKDKNYKLYNMISTPNTKIYQQKQKNIKYDAMFKEYLNTDTAIVQLCQKYQVSESDFYRERIIRCSLDEEFQKMVLARPINHGGRKKLDKKIYDKAIEMYLSNEIVSNILKECQISRASLYRELDRRNIPRTRK